MNPTPRSPRLYAHLTTVLALEQDLDQRLRLFLDAVAGYPEVAALLKDLRDTDASHQQALRTRLSALQPELTGPPTSAACLAAEGEGETAFPASTSLTRLSALLQEIIAHYVVLIVLCRRTADSHVSGPGNTGDLAQQHLQHYTEAAQRVARLLPGTVVLELEQDGQSCRCTCPSCGLGICLCAPSTRRTLGLAWTEAGSHYDPDAILMVQPRPRSVAAEAGLQRGDEILAVDGKEIGGFVVLQDAVRGQAAGEEIRLVVKRHSGEQEEVNIRRP